MLIKMKNLIALAFFCLMFWSCNTNPEDLAKEYCSCRADIEKGVKSEKDCASLAESHSLKLQDEPNQLKLYTGKILDCISNADLNTRK